MRRRVSIVGRRDMRDATWQTLSVSIAEDLTRQATAIAQPLGNKDIAHSPSISMESKFDFLQVNLRKMRWAQHALYIDRSPRVPGYPYSGTTLSEDRRKGTHYRHRTKLGSSTT